MQTKHWRIFLAAGLTLTAIVLSGILIWRLYLGPTANKPSRVSSPDNNPAMITSPANDQRFVPDWLTPVEKSVLNAPSASASSEIRKNHLDLAIRLSRVTQTLMIRDCFSIPTVIRVDRGQVVQVENLDNRKHVLSFDRQNKFEVPANGKSTYTVTLPKNGLYGYACDYYNKATGMMLVGDK